MRLLVVRSETTRASEIDRACSLLRAADASFASALAILGNIDVEAATGLPAEMAVLLGAGATRPDARMLVHAAAVLREMPFTRAAFARGRLSWGQVRAVVQAVRMVGIEGRAQIDALVDTVRGSDPDEVLARVDDLVASLRADLTLRREDRQIETSFLAVQPKLGGGSSFYGEADDETTAVMLEALDAASDRPVLRDDSETRSRARQRLDGLRNVCESYLAGSSEHRPRPRLIATFDIADAEAGARVLWSLAGRPGRLTPLSTEVLTCDSEIVPVLFDGARPVAVGDSKATVTDKQRAALEARDRGCRFPGCGAPVAWTDAHHVTHRRDGGATKVEGMMLLCRRCHRRVHRFHWRIELHADATATFIRRGRSYTSAPRE